MCFVFFLSSILLCANACSADEIDYKESCVVESAVIRNDLKKIFTEINEQANKYNDWQELFPGWKEEEVLNFFEDLQLTAIDYDLTQEGMARYGVGYEINPVIRGLYRAKVNPGALLLPVSAGWYVLLKNMNSTERRAVLLLVGVMEYWAIESHRPNGITPSEPRKVPIFTILRIKF